MKPQFYIGIDISKLTLDIAILTSTGVLEQQKIDNTEAAFTNLLRTLKSSYKATRFNTFYCAENMGIYATFLKKIALKKKLVVCFENPMQIKQSLGIQRGKNDAIDALRIAKYARMHWAKLKVWQPPRLVIEQLKTLSSLRKKLVKTKVMLSSSKKLESYYLTNVEKKKLANYSKESILGIQTDIGRIEEEMDALVADDERLTRLMEIVTSVPRIGTVVGRDIIIYTNEFEEGWTARKFASYCGIAPFDKSSGTSLKGRTRVSPIANREIKASLHLAAIGVVQMKKSFLGLYYQRKVAEGKNKMNVINAVRNKLVHRIFSCVRSDNLFAEIPC